MVSDKMREALEKQLQLLSQRSEDETDNLRLVAMSRAMTDIMRMFEEDDALLGHEMWKLATNLLKAHPELIDKSEGQDEDAPSEST